MLGENIKLSGHFVNHLLLTLASIRVEVSLFSFLLVLLRFGFGEACWFQLLHPLHVERGDTLALRLEALHGDKLLRVYLQRRALRLRAVRRSGRCEVDLYAWERRVGEQQ